MVFRIASSPYTHNQRQTSRIMLLVLLAAVPGIVVQTWFFGWGTVLQIVLAALTAWATEAAILKLRKQPVASTLRDNSALLTGLLLAVSIPPLAPWWTPAFSRAPVARALVPTPMRRQSAGSTGSSSFTSWAPMPPPWPSSTTTRR